MEFRAGSVENMGRLGLDSNFWKGKKVYVTGHTGFKGAWLCLWLQARGATVAGYSLPPSTTPNLFTAASVDRGMNSQFGDIRNLESLDASIKKFCPDVVFHMAAQPLVRLSYNQPVETYETNLMGTVNVLEAVRRASTVKVLVNITTDKCYENNEWVWGYREDEPMGGHDPYSSSKGCAELATAAYRKSFFNKTDTTKVATARAGNVIGGGDWADDRLIPDILSSFEKNIPVSVRNPKATRPWQHVLEPLSGYLVLAEYLYNHGESFVGAWNFGPNDDDVKPVSDIVTYMAEKWGSGATWIHDESNHPHEAQLLKLDISKAKNRLNWSPKWNLSEGLDSIIEWHKIWSSGGDARKITLEQISKYELS